MMSSSLLVLIFCHVSTLERGGFFSPSFFFVFVAVLISAHVQEQKNLLSATVMGDFYFVMSLFLWTCPAERITSHRVEMIP